MTIIKAPRGRRKKQKPNAKQRELADSWAQLLAKHDRPLERGAKAKGITVVAASVEPDDDLAATKAKLVVGSRSMGVAVKPVVDPLRAEKKALAARTGQAYNKGGIQYLSDDELKEQRTGAHKRR